MTFPERPEAVVANASSNRSSGNRCVITGPTSTRPVDSSVVVCCQRPEHLASRDPLQPRFLEDDLIVQIQRHRPVGQPKERHAAAAGEHLRSLVDRARVPAHLEHHLRTGPVRRVHHRGNRIDVRRVDAQVGPHARRHRSTVVVRLDRDHLPRSERTSDRHGEQSDRATPDHRDGVRGDVFPAARSERRVHGVAERLHDRRRVGMDALPDDPCVRRGDHDVLRERPLDVDAQDPEVLADVRPAGSTGRAPPTRDMGLGGHERAGVEVVNLGPHRLDRTGDLVPERHR